MPPSPESRIASEAQFGLWETFKRRLAHEPKRLEGDATLGLVVAAHEWSLPAPLTVKGKENFRATLQISVDLYVHQVNAAAFFRRLSPRGPIAADVGLGKTITAGPTIRELALRGNIDKLAVFGQGVALGQWKDFVAKGELQ